MEADLIAPTIVELRRSRRRVVCHRRCLFERAAVLEVRGDPGRAEAVIAELGADPGRSRSPADLRIGI